MNLLFAILKTQSPTYPVEQWQNWVMANNVNQEFTNYSKREGVTYPFWRVNMLPHDYAEKLSDFPEFVEYIRSLPITLEAVYVISQIPETPLQWHHDFDIGGVGIRICLAGEDEGDQEILPTHKFLGPEVKDISISRPPFIQTEYGLLREEYLSYVLPDKIVKPKGVKTGVTWLVTSRWGLHRVLPQTKPRIQCILRGTLDMDALKLLVDENSIILPPHLEKK